MSNSGSELNFVEIRARAEAALSGDSASRHAFRERVVMSPRHFPLVFSAVEVLPLLDVIEAARSHLQHTEFCVDRAGDDVTCPTYTRLEQALSKVNFGGEV